MPRRERKRYQPRFDVGVAGRYRVGRGVARDVELYDLSGNGCRFFDRFGRLEEGSDITLRIGAVGPILANVRWRKNGYVGVCFEPPLHEAVLDHLRALHPRTIIEDVPLAQAV